MSKQNNAHILKQKYRVFFKKYSTFINYSYFLKQANIAPSNFSNFLNKNSDAAMSLQKLLSLHKLISSFVSEMSKKAL